MDASAPARIAARAAAVGVDAFADEARDLPWAIGARPQFAPSVALGQAVAVAIVQLVHA